MTNPPVEIAAWLACLAFVVMLVNGVLKLVDRAKDKPAPGDVARESADKFVAKPEFNKHVERNQQEHDNFFSRLGGVDRGAAAKISAEVTAVHNRVNILDKSVGGLETASEMTNQQLARVEAKIDRLIERRP